VPDDEPPDAFAIGLGHICALVGQQGFVARAAATGRREAAFGTLTAASSLGQLVGPIVVTSVASVGTTSP
jgi:hypothetical protein